LIVVLYVDPFIGIQVNRPMTPKRDDIVAGDELKIPTGRMMLC
jgi:hypothetical protein